VSTNAAQLISARSIIGVALAFDVYCLRDLAGADVTFVFPPQVWMLVIVFTTPLGGIAYLKLGRPR
jgi:hypothetical protein